jgi:hypothetical protein
VQIRFAAQSLLKVQAVEGAGFPEPPPQPANTDAETRTRPTAIDRIETFILTSSP